jgi:hypothetical protein
MVKGSSHERLYEAKLELSNRRYTKILVSAQDHKDAWRLARHGARSYGGKVTGVRHVYAQIIFGESRAT